jgi:thiol-disulfide isomerase/thioredoxin/outer membrane lipoprotein-sorting protein
MTKPPLVFFVLCLFSIVPVMLACQPAPPDPLEILKQANSAAAKLITVSYEAKFYGDGSLAAQIPPMDGKVSAKRDPAGNQHQFRIEGSAADQNPAEKSRFTLAFDGRNICSADHTRKTFSSAQLEGGRGVTNPLFQPKYLHNAPFDDEIKNGTLEYNGVQDVDGVACDVIGVRGGAARPALTKLFLGKADHILRRFEATVQSGPPPAGSTSPATARIIFTITALALNPEIKDDAFRLDCPDGYEKKILQAERPGQPSPQQSALLAAGSEAPNWDLKASDGKAVSLKNLRGKVVVLDFWATWCGPCKLSMPGMQKLHEKFKDKPVVIYGVNCRERLPNADPMAYIKEKGYTYGQLLKADDVAEKYRVNGIPCIYIIGPDGKILNTFEGYSPSLEDTMADIITKAMKK